MSDVIRRLNRVRDKWIAIDFVENAVSFLADHKHARGAASAYAAVAAELSRLPEEVPWSLRCDRMACFARRAWPSLRRMPDIQSAWAAALRLPEGVSKNAWDLLLNVGLEPLQAAEKMIAIYAGQERACGGRHDHVAQEAMRRRRMHESGDTAGLSRTPEPPGEEPTVFAEIPLTIPKAAIVAAIQAARNAGDVKRANELASLFASKAGRGGHPAS